MSRPPRRVLHPSHGVHDQRARTPARAANSVRRTTTIDSFRFDGAAGPTTVSARGRDLLTDGDGAAVELDEVDFGLTLEPLRSVIATVRDLDGAKELLGVDIAVGFRRVLNRLTAPADRSRLRHRLLDDLPGAVLVGSMPLVTAGVYPVRPRELLVLTDVCRGWAEGGSQHRDIAIGRIPTPTGPAPTDLRVPEDPLAWHAEAPRTHDHMRRGRRIDVLRTPAGLTIDAHFRDVSVPVAGAGEVIHEYSVSVRADETTREVTAISATAHALPWQDCNSVPESARELLGARLGELETTVRTRLSGTAGCTHLNDTFRGLDAVPLLAGFLA